MSSKTKRIPGQKVRHKRYLFICRHRLLLLLSLCLLWEQPSGLAQTCCSGGVPLSNNVGSLPLTDAGGWQFAVNFDANILRTLKNETRLLDDRSRERITYSTLLSAAFTFDKRWSVQTLFSWVRQERFIQQHGGFTDFTVTQGIGDAVLLASYTYLNTRHWSLAAGAGPKVPFGSADLKSRQGFTLNADLQPGSGAWDGILNHRAFFSVPGRPSFVFTNQVIFRITGTNPEYLGSQNYRFGNELQIITGLSEQLLLGRQIFNISIGTRYRKVLQDINNREILPNTGGSWLFLMPAISWLPVQTLGLTYRHELPLYSRVTGTQLSPTNRFNVGIYLHLQKEEKDTFKF